MSHADTVRLHGVALTVVVVAYLGCGRLMERVRVGVGVRVWGVGDEVSDGVTCI